MREARKRKHPCTPSVVSRENNETRREGTCSKPKRKIISSLGHEIHRSTVVSLNNDDNNFYQYPSAGLMFAENYEQKRLSMSNKQNQ